MDWSYIAGYFDGEGNVTIHKNRQSGGSIRRLSWYNTHLESLEAMQSFMGCGRITRQDKKNRKKPIYALIITRRQHLIQVLDQLAPLLIIKREAAEALRAELELMRDESLGFGKIVALSTEQLRQWYEVEQMSCGDIARMLGVDHSGISRELKARGIEKRPRNDGHMKGKPKSEETRQRMKAAQRKMWEDPEFRARQLENLKLGRKARRQ